MKGRVLLVRHTQVALSWRGRCYGQTDVGLSRAGRRQAMKVAADIVRQMTPRHGRPIVVHSGLRRAAVLAEAIAELLDVEPQIDTRWRERDFNTWEGRTWHSIWRQTGNAMDRMLTDARGFRPGGGETTAELVARSIAAWRALPLNPSTIVVSHGGPIACVRAVFDGAPPQALVDYLLAEGAAARFERRMKIPRIRTLDSQ